MGQVYEQLPAVQLIPVGLCVVSSKERMIGRWNRLNNPYVPLSSEGMFVILDCIFTETLLGAMSLDEKNYKHTHTCTALSI